MNFETTLIMDPALVTILKTHGDIDGSNYREFISVVQKLYKEGTRNLLLDLGDTAFISSSGLVALHSITLLLNGGQPLNVEEGWDALHSMGQGLSALQPHLKLLNVGPRVDRSLDISGFKPYFEIFTDRDAALASFQQKTTPAAP